MVTISRIIWGPVARGTQLAGRRGEEAGGLLIRIAGPQPLFLIQSGVGPSNWPICQEAQVIRMLLVLLVETPQNIYTSKRRPRRCWLGGFSFFTALGTSLNWEKIVLFSCAVLNRKALFDVIWPGCQHCAASWWLFLFRFSLCKRRISKQLFRVVKLHLVTVFVCVTSKHRLV